MRVRFLPSDDTEETRVYFRGYFLEASSFFFYVDSYPRALIMINDPRRYNAQSGSKRYGGFLLDTGSICYLNHLLRKDFSNGTVMQNEAGE